MINHLAQLSLSSVVKEIFSGTTFFFPSLRLWDRLETAKDSHFTGKSAILLAPLYYPLQTPFPFICYLIPKITFIYVYPQ